MVLKNGKITEQGTYSQLVENKGEFNEFLLQYLSEKEEEELDDDLEGEAFLSMSYNPRHLLNKLLCWLISEFPIFPAYLELVLLRQL